MHKKKFYYLIVVLMLFLGFNLFFQNPAKAGDLPTASFRIIATGDLHGQVTSYNCETGQNMPKEGFSKLATLIRQKRMEAGADNTLLVDAGDFFYDYTSNFFYDNYKNLTQPILKAMSDVGYDYITLGNHEFDYPWEYLKKQLDNSGFSDRVLLCNAVWHDSGKSVFAPSTVITRTLVTSDHQTITAKIGIIGSTTNSISTRRGDYVNVIDASNNYNSIVSEAKRLKAEEKVDLVLVILHGGIGTAGSGGSGENVGYALTKVPSIDAIVTAHTHEAFPDAANPDITLSGADNHTGCINGKPVVATSSHACALGTIDLTFQVNSDKSLTISGGKSMITYADSNVSEDPAVKASFADYLDKLRGAADTSSYKIEKGITYHNYDTVVQDSNLYQLLNNAKIAYGLTYATEYLPEYKNEPVIACTRNLLDGSNPWLNIRDTLSAEKISQILSESSASRSSGYIKMYEISGRQLREWLEYNASLYAASGTRFHTILQNYSSAHKESSTLLKEEYIYNWNRQFVFDGISYTIDLTKQPRYSAQGNLINSGNKRIVNLTRNGAAITDSQKFLLVTDSGIPKLSFLPSESDDTIKEVRNYETSKNITLNYIKEISTFGNITVKADHNWALKAGSGYTFLLGVPKNIAKDVTKLSWNRGQAAETASYAFFKGVLPALDQKINMIVAQGRTEQNNEPVPVVISVSSKYALKEIRYLPGKIASSSASGWLSADTVKNNVFTVNSNGIYTVLATDAKGNHVLSYINVDRYAKNLLAAPKLDRLTNRNTVLTGTAVPNTIIHVTIGAHSYSSRVDANGKFSFGVNAPKAFEMVSAYIDAAGKKSTVVTAAVRKTGPNAVQVNPVRIGDTCVTGSASPDSFAYALIWNTVYVGTGKTEAYRKSDFYKSTYKIVETNITMDPETGEFKIHLPAIKSNMNVYVYNVDRFGTTSRSTMVSPE